MKLIIFGAGTIAKAVAFDLSRNKDVEKVKILSAHKSPSETLKDWVNSDKVEAGVVDVSNKDAVVKALKDFDGAISCVPYKFNFNLAKACIQSKVHFVDLGGNNDVVQKELSLNDSAKKANVLIVPDCGLAPGLVSVFTKAFVEEFDEIDSVKLRVGGLPQNPLPPLDYALVFSVKGLINEYVEPVTVIKDHDVMSVEPLSFKEDISFSEFPKLEAFSTSGGTSTLPQNFKSKIRNLDYKTIRHSGHLDKIRLLYDLGFMSSEVLDNFQNSPRDVLEALLNKYLPRGDKDLVLLRASCSGKIDGDDSTISYEVVDKFDSSTGLTAMMRMTAFPAASLLIMICSGQIKETGVLTQELFVPVEELLDVLAEKGIEINKIQD